MNCFPCFSRMRSRSNETATSRGLPGSSAPEFLREKLPGNKKGDNVEDGNIAAQIFTFRELATATKNFRQECLIGEGGFGRVYKAKLDSGQTVAVKQLDRNGLQGNKEFLVEVLMLSLLHHQNLVNLIGYCADGDQRLLVYEYMTEGSLEDHLLADTGAEKRPLDWYTRMKIASGAARGLEYLHDKANPPVIYRDFKSSNILLDEDYNPKLSDFGLAKLGSVGDKVHVSSRVMGTYGYCAPEYAQAGELTLKSDVYSFGVVLLELITGRRAVDNTRPTDQQNLVTWAQPIFKDPKRYPDMADPILNKQFPVSSLNQAVAIASMCLQDEASVRPLISDVVTALSFLSVVPDTPLPVAQETCVKQVEKSSDHENKKHQSDHDSESSEGETMDSDEYEEDEQSEDDRQRAVTEAKEWASSASFRSSQGSRYGSTPSSRNSSMRVQNGSSSRKSYVGLRIESTSMSSNSGSIKKSLSHKSSSVKSQHGNVVPLCASKNSSSNKSHDDIGISLSASNSSRKSHDDIGISLSASSSRKSYDDTGISLSATNSRKSDDIGISLSASNSNRKSDDYIGISSSASNSRGSQEGTAFSILESSEKSGDESHSSIPQMTHKSSTKSQNKHGYVSHRLSHKLSNVSSTGSQNESVSSRQSSKGRSGNGRLVSLSQSSLSEDHVPSQS